MQQAKNILIRLPNWLGDMVMSTALVKAVQQQYPDAQIDFIAKKGLDFLLEHFPVKGHCFAFDKSAYKGLKGVWEFGKQLGKQKKYDLFFCLPDSFSSAVMAKAVGAKKTIGYKNELRSMLLTHGYKKQKQQHRVEEYIDLLQQFLGKSLLPAAVELTNSCPATTKQLVININSEASSRRLPAEKAISIINMIRGKISEDIILIGSLKEKEFVDSVYNMLNNKTGIHNLSANTNLPQLLLLLSNSALMLSTDSGPAHVSNALGTHTIVLFGAGNEYNTSPYDKTKRTIIRLGKLNCEPCASNICKLYAQPECLLQLDESMIAQKVSDLLKSNP